FLSRLEPDDGIDFVSFEAFRQHIAARLRGFEKSRRSGEPSQAQLTPDSNEKAPVILKSNESRDRGGEADERADLQLPIEMKTLKERLRSADAAQEAFLLKGAIHFRNRGNRNPKMRGHFADGMEGARLLVLVLHRDVAQDRGQGFSLMMRFLQRAPVWQ